MRAFLPLVLMVSVMFALSNCEVKVKTRPPQEQIIELFGGDPLV